MHFLFLVFGFGEVVFRVRNESSERVVQVLEEG